MPRLNYFENAIFTAMAGNIIPAIASTNAIIAALIVMEGLKILSGRIDTCKSVGTVSYKFSPFPV